MAYQSKDEDFELGNNSSSTNPIQEEWQVNQEKMKNDAKDVHQTENQLYKMEGQFEEEANWGDLEEEMDYNKKLSFSDEEVSGSSSQDSPEEFGYGTEEREKFTLFRSTLPPNEFNQVAFKSKLFELMLKINESGVGDMPRDENIGEKVLIVNPNGSDESNITLALKTSCEHTQLFKSTLKLECTGEMLLDEKAGKKLIIINPGANISDRKFALKAFSKGRNGGVLFNMERITLSEDSQYRLGRDYKRDDKPLGRGTRAVVYKSIDTATKTYHAEKVQKFDKDLNEVQFMDYFQNSTCFPKVYLVKRIGEDTMSTHMELIEGKTSRQIINENREAILKNSKVKAMWLPFCLFVLEDGLFCFETYASEKWSHGDITCENMIFRRIEQLIELKFIDFDTAEEEQSFGDQEKDFWNILVVFVYLLSGREFFYTNVFTSLDEIKDDLLPGNYELLTEVMRKGKWVYSLDDVREFKIFINEMKNEQLKVINITENTMKEQLIQRIFALPTPALTV